MIKKLMILAVVICCGAGLMSSAQEMDEPSPEREIYTALGYGDGVFEPDLWLASAAETTANTTATWNATSLGALSYLDYRHFPEGTTKEEIDALFDNVWFEAVFANYTSWRKTGVCYDGDLTLHEFELKNNDTSYNMRYWVEPLEENTRVRAHFIVFPVSYQAELEEYAARLFPKFASCQRRR